MENEKNPTTQDNGGSGQEEKTFTQEEVNEIVQRRLAKDRKIRADEVLDSENDLKNREKALRDRENELYAKEAFKNNGLPDDLLVIVKGKSSEETDNIIKTLKPYIDKTREPILNPVMRTSGNNSGMDVIREAMGLKR